MKEWGGVGKGIGHEAVVDITEEKIIDDVQFLAEVVAERMPGYTCPDAFVVKRIVNRGGVECAVLVEDTAASTIQQSDVQRFISMLNQVHPPVEDARHIACGSLFGDGPMFFLCPTQFLKRKSLN